MQFKYKKYYKWTKLMKANIWWNSSIADLRVGGWERGWWINWWPVGGRVINLQRRRWCFQWVLRGCKRKWRNLIKWLKWSKWSGERRNLKY